MILNIARSLVSRIIFQLKKINLIITKCYFSLVLHRELSGSSAPHLLSPGLQLSGAPSWHGLLLSL